MKKIVAFSASRLTDKASQALASKRNAPSSKPSPNWKTLKSFMSLLRLKLARAPGRRANRRRQARFISGLMSQKIPFIVADLGPNVDPFMLHIYAALAEKERGMIAERTRAALGAAKQRGVRLGNPRLGEARLVRSGKRCPTF
jgi:DNA invertase Pin-like site-specific DNA recombinase